MMLEYGEHLSSCHPLWLNVYSKLQMSAVLCPLQAH